MFKKLRRWLVRAQLKRAGAAIAGDLQSADSFFDGHAEGFSCGRSCFISAGVRIMVSDRGGVNTRLALGSNVFINHYAVIDCHHSITIGNHVLIGPNVYICDFDHDTAVRAGDGFESEFVYAPVRVGNHVWIGANAVVLKGVTIGDGAVVGAGSVVTRDVAPMAVVAGVPAALLRHRKRVT